MDHFLYRNGILHAEDVAIPEIAAKVGTPAALRRTGEAAVGAALFAVAAGAVAETPAPIRLDEAPILKASKLSKLMLEPVRSGRPSSPKNVIAANSVWRSNRMTPSSHAISWWRAARSNASGQRPHCPAGACRTQCQACAEDFSTRRPDGLRLLASA